MQWVNDNPRLLVDSYKQTPIDGKKEIDLNVALSTLKGLFILAVVEHVRDGCTVRAFLLPSFEYVSVMLSGIKVCICLFAFVCIAIMFYSCISHQFTSLRKLVIFK